MSSINLKKLAEHLNLSQTTVSRALNDYPEVKETTRNRVKETAKVLGYQPNTRAQGLATGRVKAIGHVFPISNKLDIVNPIFGDFLAGAGEVYAQEGYEAVISVVDADKEEEAYRAMRSRGSVDGVVIHGPLMDDPRITLLEELGLPFVTHGRATDHKKPYSWVDVNNRGAFHHATTHLLDLGHRRIALINGPEHMDFAHRRRQGFEAAHRDRSLQPDPALMTSHEMTEGFGWRSTRQMLASSNPPTAIVVSSIISAFGAKRAVEESGFQLGKDISLITFDDDLSYLRNQGEVPVFSSSRSSVRTAGREVAKMLIEKIKDPERTIQPVLLEAELTIGKSTGAARPL